MKLNESIMRFLSTLVPAKMEMVCVAKYENIKNGCGSFDCEGGCSGDCEGSCSGDCPGGCSGSCSGEVW